MALTKLSGAVLSGLLLFGLSCYGEDEGAKILLHVTSVRQEEAKDYCTSGKCSAMRFLVEAYSIENADSATEYTLECVATLPVPLSKDSVVIPCPRLHAGGEYLGKLSVDLTGRAAMCVDVGACYNLLSEREVRVAAKPSVKANSAR